MPTKTRYLVHNTSNFEKLCRLQELGSFVSNLPLLILVFYGSGFLLVKPKGLAMHCRERLEGSQRRTGAPEHGAFHARSSEVGHPKGLSEHLS